MEDDGLLVNFVQTELPASSKEIVRGGRWRDRLQRKRTLQRRHVFKGSNATEINAERDFGAQAEEDRPTKKAKTTEVERVGAVQDSHAPQRSGAEVVSSLFTSNPAAYRKAKTDDAKDAAVEPIPSNAPLPEGATNFTSLGLNANLSSHIIKALSLKTPTAIQQIGIAKLLESANDDAFVQAETGSGKTLAYLLPIIHHLMSFKTANGSSIDRKSGLFALIIVPTRELVHQIEATLLSLLQRLPNIVSGAIAGGATKKHEKARIRKGLNVLVATPGRLVDHLENTATLDLSEVKWLVLDEGDRLVELGFEEDIMKVVQALDERTKAQVSSAVLNLPKRRVTILCSATMKMGVQKLGENSLKDAMLIQANEAPKATGSIDGHAESDRRGAVDAEKTGTCAKATINGSAPPEGEANFLAPAQLRQTFIVAPAKQRLVTLAALLKSTFVRRGSVMKAIIFLSCADSVDFHFQVLTRQDRYDDESGATAADSSGSASKDQLCHQARASPSLTSTANPEIQIFKLHGSLPQAVRTATLRSFAGKTASASKKQATPAPVQPPSILLCTDVASRGLDLPSIDLVIEYDPAFSAPEHLHRVGRTARAGRGGHAICFLQPGPEEAYVDNVLRKATPAAGHAVKGEGAEDTLQRGFARTAFSSGPSSSASAGRTWRDRATDWQLEIERWISSEQSGGSSKASTSNPSGSPSQPNGGITDLARRAYTSHVRAYATHIARERDMFDVKALHLGHLAKAFGLREPPKKVGRHHLGHHEGERSLAGGGKGGVGGNDRRNSQRPSRKGEGGAAAADADAGGERQPSSAMVQAGKVEHSGKKDSDRDRMRRKMKEIMSPAGEFNIS